LVCEHDVGAPPAEEDVVVLELEVGHAVDEHAPLQQYPLQQSV
jgi:hypothetical protein